MEPQHTPSERRHGFRFSVWDALILLSGFGLALWLRSEEFALWWVVLAAVGHFFLFCNVFLVWRRWELGWAVIFVINVAAHVAYGIFGWLSPILVQLPVTVLVIMLQIRSPWYHGIFARRLNPHLDGYLQNKS